MPNATLAALTPPNNKKTRNADAYLARQHNLLASYETLDHFVCDGEDQLAENDFQSLMLHLLNLRIALAGLFWRNGIFIGRSILDEFIFQVAKSGAGPILPQVITEFTQTAAGQAGFVIYPLHGFGFEVAPMLRHDPELKSFYSFKSFGMAISAQTGSLETTRSRLNQMARQLGVKSSIDLSDLTHHSLAGNLKWLTQNPLMMVSLASHTGEYYENQFIYTLKVRLAATLTVMLWALSENKTPNLEERHLSTSASINNWETLDVRHYLVGEARLDPKDSIEFRRIPMNLAPLDLAQLSDVRVTLSTRRLKTAWIRTRRIELESAMAEVEQAYMNHVNLGLGSNLKRRVYARLLKALDWFRRSFGSQQTTHERVVALAVAYETMLTDFYARGTDEKLARRVGICLRGKPGVTGFKNAITTIVHHRNEILHTGQTNAESDIVKAQAGFALCFIDLAARLPNLPTTSGNPIQEILGDTTDGNIV